MLHIIYLWWPDRWAKFTWDLLLKVTQNGLKSPRAALYVESELVLLPWKSAEAVPDVKESFRNPSFATDKADSSWNPLAGSFIDSLDWEGSSPRPNALRLISLYLKDVRRRNVLPVAVAVAVAVAVLQAIVVWHACHGFGKLDCKTGSGKCKESASEVRYNLWRSLNMTYQAFVGLG